MDLKILDEEHFILSAKAEVMGRHWLIYTPSDAVVVNEDAPEVGENFVKLMILYLESTDWGAERSQGADPERALVELLFCFRRDYQNQKEAQPQKAEYLMTGKPTAGNKTLLPFLCPGAGKTTVEIILAALTGAQFKPSLSMEPEGKNKGFQGLFWGLFGDYTRKKTLKTGER